MTDRTAVITSWIRSLPENAAQDTSCASTTTKKRKQQQHQQHTGPPASIASVQEADYWRRPTSVADPDSTPSLFSSRASFPRRQMLNLRLHEPVLEFNALNLNALPPAARELLATVTEIGSNQDILPDAMKSSVMEAVTAHDPMPRLWRYAFKSAADDEADALLPGRIPAFYEVQSICKKASECQEYGREEVSWNCAVHARLLELTLEDENGRLCDEFDAMIRNTTDRLDPAWQPFLSQGKMIDIYAYHPSTDEALRAKIDQFSRLTPTGTVDHTDFYPISGRPPVLSIETKKPGVHWKAAQLQIGLWHAAEWAFLQRAVADKLRRQAINDEEQDRGGSAVEGAEHDATETKVLSVISELGFIPGVIVQGHRWHFVLSTYEDRKTKLWGDRQFGSTQTCLESYSAIAGIRRVTAWTRDVYMPWYKSHVLV